MSAHVSAVQLVTDGPAQLVVKKGAFGFGVFPGAHKIKTGEFIIGAFHWCSVMTHLRACTAEYVGEHLPGEKRSEEKIVEIERLITRSSVEHR